MRKNALSKLISYFNSFGKKTVRIWPLTKKTFFAQQWLQNDQAARSLSEDPSGVKADVYPSHKKFPSFVQVQKSLKTKIEFGDRFSPLHCFTPGWKGESLASKSMVKFDQLMTSLQSDIKAELFKTKDFPKTIKIGLYNEFLSYAESLGLHFNGLDDLGTFWQSIEPEKIAENEKMLEFIDIYTNRVATITFLKLRFISSLVDNSSIELTDKALLYPTSFLSQIFKKGSLTELNSRALESNIYSWYSPKEWMRPIMKELLQLSRDLAFTEIIKNVSHRTQVTQDQQKVYSHALSHVSMGLFLNSLQINFPLWLETVEGQSLPLGSLEDEQVISCKYFGDYLESLSTSHWLAQENNKEFKWDQILCPDFKGLEFISGTFTKICNELQFLTFLASKSGPQGEKPVEWISSIMGRHFSNRKNASAKQTMLLEENPFYTSTYDRVVLNLCQFPKNNPQHYLMTQILDQVKYLKSNGYLFVLSSKKLFVPSLRERLEPILKELKVEAIFDLENVKGKGELGSYIYVFRKKTSVQSEKQLCSYFRISVDLSTFQEFAPVTEHLRSFYLSHLTEMPSMAQLDFTNDFRVEYFQEAVVNGMLIHSTSEDSSRITHPAYFKGLLDSCVPLDTLFDIKHLSAPSQSDSRESIMNLGLRQDILYFLVVDFRQPEVNLELHPMDTFRSIFSDYGQTQCSYFQLQAKIPGLNPNILRNYFQTAVGKQVSHLTFSGGHNLVKGSLSKFLVPKFLKETEGLPSHLRDAFKMLEMSEESLLEQHPATVMKTFTHIDQITRDLFPRYACEILSRFSNLEHLLQSLIYKMDDSRFGQKISFQNPLIQAQLVQKPTRALYPDNDDVFIEFVAGSNPRDLHSPLTSAQIKITHEGELKLYALELISGTKTIVRLHAEEALVLFVHYILSQAIDVPISKLLQAVHVPKLSDLKIIIDSSVGMKNSYQELLKRVEKAIVDAFRLHVTPKRP